jgi:hypothetical protein
MLENSPPKEEILTVEVGDDFNPVLDWIKLHIVTLCDCGVVLGLQMELLSVEGELRTCTLLDLYEPEILTIFLSSFLVSAQDDHVGVRNVLHDRVTLESDIVHNQGAN